MVELMPFENKDSFYNNAKSIWLSLSENEWLEAFDAHPKIGDINSLKEKYSRTSNTSSQEQSKVDLASNKTLEELQKLNQDYENKFGFIFIVFATGKTADTMLSLLKSRINNTKDQELQNAALEQLKITHLRMEALL